MFSITLKMAVDAPIPSASVSAATMANPGVFRKFLSAYRISCPSVSMESSAATGSLRRLYPTLRSCLGLARRARGQPLARPHTPAFPLYALACSLFRRRRSQ